jgi:hypothetical protein
MEAKEAKSCVDQLHTLCRSPCVANLIQHCCNSYKSSLRRDVDTGVDPFQNKLEFIKDSQCAIDDLNPHPHLAQLLYTTKKGTQRKHKSKQRGDLMEGVWPCRPTGLKCNSSKSKIMRFFCCFFESSFVVSKKSNLLAYKYISDPIVVVNKKLVYIIFLCISIWCYNLLQ